MTTTAAAPTAVGAWTVDPVHSTASFAVRHMVVSTFRGGFADVRGSLEQRDGAPVLSGHVAAGERYEAATALAPENAELIFWAGLAAAQAGSMDLALERVRAAIALGAQWRELLDRLEPDIAPSAPAVRAALGG